MVVENDANAAAWAEYRFGAARGRDDVVMLTVGTGIGGALVLGWPAAPRPVRPGRRGRPPGRWTRTAGTAAAAGAGCWEQYASGNALLRDARNRAAQDRDRARVLLSYGDGTPEGVAGPHVTAAAQAGDPVALETFEEVGYWLGRGMAELAAVLDPGSYVVGGGVSEAGELLLAPARREFVAHVVGADVRPIAEIVSAGLGNLAGLVGAADLARARD